MSGSGASERADRKERRPRVPIVAKLLVFNLLLVFFPLLGVLGLDAFERQLLLSQERSMAQQARLLAASLSGRGPLDGEAARLTLDALGGETFARLRVVDRAGVVLADSSRRPRADATGGAGSADASSAATDDAESEARATPLYRAGAWLYRLVQGSGPIDEADVRAAEPPGGAGPPGPPRLDGPEVGAAIAGRYGATTQRTPGQRSLVLRVAVPIRDDGAPIGAVHVTQSTIRLLAALDRIRLDTFRLIVAALVTAAILSLLMALTISRPLRRLRVEAETLLDRRGRLRGSFRGLRRGDEIGALARSLEALSARLADQVRFTDAFASDLVHELRNPLASMRAAAELLPEVEDPERRARFAATIQEEVRRLERLLDSVRELAAVDAESRASERVPVDLGEVAAARAEVLALRFEGEDDPPRVRVEASARPLVVGADPDRLVLAIDNLLENARTFSPPAGTITLRLGDEAEDGRHLAVLRVEDEGPGIPDEHLDRVFDRFFSYRPDDPDRADHTGLGLALVRAIATDLDGAVLALPSERGARLELRLPLHGASAGA